MPQLMEYRAEPSEEQDSERTVAGQLSEAEGRYYGLKLQVYQHVCNTTQDQLCQSLDIGTWPVK